MSEVVVTIKAGTGYDTPWVVFHADSIEEAEYQLDNAVSILEKASFLSKRFAQVYASTPNGVAELIKQELGGTVVSIEPTYSEPDEVQGPTNTESPKPWERAAPAAPKPWEKQAAPPSSGKPLIKLPYTEKDETEGSPYMLQREFKNYFFQQRNKLNWNAARKGFEFTSHPTAELLQVARNGAASFGGSVEG